MTNRKATYPIELRILQRWSPRAMSGELLEHKEFMRLIEAARWAPSSYNNQPWRFIYAHRTTAYWEKIFNLMVPFNQSWAKNASTLIVAFSKKTFDYNGKPSINHTFDTGLACENLALQGSAMGLIVHMMEGFDYQKAHIDLRIPDDHEIHVMIAVGIPGKKENLPLELQKREEPSDRRPIEEIVFEGTL